MQIRSRLLTLVSLIVIVGLGPARPLAAQESYASLVGTSFEIRYASGVSEAEAQKVLDYLQDEYRILSKELGVEAKSKIEVRIHESVGRFLSEAGLKRPWRGAFYHRAILHVQPVRALILRDIFTQNLSYELVRALLEPAGEKGCPLWLRESFAAYHVGEYKKTSAPLGARLSAFSDLNQDIHQHPDPPQRDDVQYMLGQTMNFLVQKYGQTRAFGLFKEFDGSTTAETVFKKTLGEDFGTVEKSWAQHISYHTTPFKK